MKLSAIQEVGWYIQTLHVTWVILLFTPVIDWVGVARVANSTEAHLWALSRSDTKEVSQIFVNRTISLLAANLENGVRQIRKRDLTLHHDQRLLYHIYKINRPNLCQTRIPLVSVTT